LQSGGFFTFTPQETQKQTMSTSYSLTDEQVQSAIAGHDLSTYLGWMGAVRALLKHAPDWVAIKHGEEGYTVAEYSQQIHQVFAQQSLHRLAPQTHQRFAFNPTTLSVQNRCRTYLAGQS
jgi:hypothetical protein